MTRIFGDRTELIFALCCGGCLAAGFSIQYFAGFGIASGIFYAVAYFFGGFFTTRQAFRSLFSGKFDIDLLMLVAAVGAALLGAFAEGGLLLFLFSLGHALEHYALDRARQSISSLAGLTPDTALVDRDGPVEIPISELHVGDVMIIKPNTRIPADGVVVEGTTVIDQSPITGESIPVSKSAIGHQDHQGITMDQVPNLHRAFAGTINGARAIRVRALKRPQDSTLARLIALVRDAEKQKSPTQRFAERFERVFVPFVLLLVAVLLFAFLIIDEPFSSSFYRAMAVLVAASPCALAISTPSAVLAGIARAARSGVLIKGGGPLERLASIQAIAFDKTGTLTEGRPVLTSVVPFGGVSKELLLSVAVAVESLSDHPIAQAVVEGAGDFTSEISVKTATNLEAVTAMGVKAKIRDVPVAIGNARLMEVVTGKPPPQAVLMQKKNLETNGQTTMIIVMGNEYLGILGIMDIPRTSAGETIRRLHQMGIRRTIMLTGDNQIVGNAVGSEVGISDVFGGLLPEEKAEKIRSLKEESGEVAMVGDGVNDAPGMAVSTVGIAMGAAGSDVTLETAEVALMSDRIDQLPFAIGLGRKTRQIIRQNIWISLGMVAVLVPLTILGIAKIGPAVIGHEGSTLVVVLNALRLLGYDLRKGA